jgi:hypothetical protein
VAGGVGAVVDHAKLQMRVVAWRLRLAGLQVRHLVTGSARIRSGPPQLLCFIAGAAIAPSVLLRRAGVW